MSFCGKRHDGAHEIYNPKVNHGNFIEIVKLVAESDATSYRTYGQSRNCMQKVITEKKEI